MRMFWYFVIYSFLGFLLEGAYAAAHGGDALGRKCFHLLPLCPVYVVGALVILSLPRPVLAHGILTALCGGLAATAVEYVVALAYERGLGVRFWDYAQFSGNWKGRVCPRFSLFWGILALALVRWVHPAVAALPGLPAPLSACAAALVLCDGIHSAVLLRRSGTTACLRWRPALRLRGRRPDQEEA